MQVFGYRIPRMNVGSPTWWAIVIAALAYIAYFV